MSGAGTYRYLDRTANTSGLFTYQLEAVALNGDAEIVGTVFIEHVAAAATPLAFQLLGARPNPFNPSTNIFFQLPVETAVRLQIFDAHGRRIRTLADQAMPAGEHMVSWNGRNDRGELLGSGIYFYEIKAGEDVLPDMPLLWVLRDVLGFYRH